MATYQDDRAARRADGLPEPAGGRRRADGENLNIVGKRLPLLDARAKAAGQTVYTDDIQLPGMLTCKILRSPWAYARIDRIDTSRAAALPGVHAVMVGTDAPITFGVLPISQDENALALEKIRHIGEGIAAVAADDEATALQALDTSNVLIFEQHFG